MSPYRDDLKALYILRENIRSLLSARKESQTALAEHVGHQRAWINKFLNDQNSSGGREVSIRDLDRIAIFFGLQTYQLFQPGISSLTERRHSIDRRSGQDRRIGHAGRQLAGLRAEVEKLPHPNAAHGTSATRHSAVPVPEPIQRILAAAERQIAAVYRELGRETPSPRADRPVVPRRRGNVRGPSA